MSVTVEYHESQYPAVEGQRCITVYIPDDDAFLPVLASLLRIPAMAEAYEGTDEAQVEGLTALWLDAYIRTEWEVCLTSQWLMTEARITPEINTGVSGNAISWVDVTGAANGGVFRQNPAAINDQIDWDIALKAGQYTVYVLGITNTSRGIQTLLINGGTLTTFDWYSASQVLNVIKSYSFTVTVDGVYSFSSKMAGKHASSTGYVMTMSYISFVRTGDV